MGSRRFGRAVCADGPDATSQPPFLPPASSCHLLTHPIPEQAPVPAPCRSQALVAPSALCLGPFTGLCLARPTNPPSGTGLAGPGEAGWRRWRLSVLRTVAEPEDAPLPRRRTWTPCAGAPSVWSFALPSAPLFRVLFFSMSPLYIFTVRRREASSHTFSSAFLLFFSLEVIPRPMSYFPCPRITLIDFSCFSKGGWM